MAPLCFPWLNGNHWLGMSQSQTPMQSHKYASGIGNPHRRIEFSDGVDRHVPWGSDRQHHFGTVQLMSKRCSLMCVLLPLQLFARHPLPLHRLEPNVFNCSLRYSTFHTDSVLSIFRCAWLLKSSSYINSLYFTFYRCTVN